MIRLKKKQEEAERKEKESESSEAMDVEQESTNGGDAKADDQDESKGGESKSSGGVKLLGIGGKKSRTGGAKKTKKRTPGELRIQKDIAELDGGNVAVITFPNPNNLTSFEVRVTPDTGMWRGATYHFTFAIPAMYPHEPPKVHCHTKIYHPNINLQGKVCLNILREDWKPVLDINAVIYGLIYLFYEPNPEDPLNREAAELYRNDARQFERVVRRSLQGYSVGAEQFERLI
uniref:UBC core domain-containing protein n=1 Tax=Heterosigma akashiwo TaxID=2829 RepID=A0A6V1TYK4_HETAK|mmetsp:Transcript_1846/g.2716  ORF Transcript_1846/g.2716 Transcript_1846/m.2716 type:complete len:232 (-) Transcript_1846:193-888(-)